MADKYDEKLPLKGNSDLDKKNPSKTETYLTPEKQKARFAKLEKVEEKDRALDVLPNLAVAYENITEAFSSKLSFFNNLSKSELERFGNILQALSTWNIEWAKNLSSNFPWSSNITNNYSKISNYFAKLSQYEKIRWDEMYKALENWDISSVWVLTFKNPWMFIVLKQIADTIKIGTSLANNPPKIEKK